VVESENQLMDVTGWFDTRTIVIVLIEVREEIGMLKNESISIIEDGNCLLQSLFPNNDPAKVSRSVFRSGRVIHRGRAADVIVTVLLLNYAYRYILGIHSPMGHVPQFSGNLESSMSTSFRVVSRRVEVKALCALIDGQILDIF
jgi:hypothetical protein